MPKPTKHHFPSLKPVLLAYAASYGIRETATQRQVAARLWRALPRGTPPAEAIAWLDSRVAAWALALLGEPLDATQVRAAFLSGGLDPLLLLRPHTDTNAAASLAGALRAARLVVAPAHTPVAMPIQALAREPLIRMLAGLFAASIIEAARA